MSEATPETTPNAKGPAPASVPPTEPEGPIIPDGRAVLSLGTDRRIPESIDIVDGEGRVVARYAAQRLHEPVWYDNMPYLPFPTNWPVYPSALR
ncbi:hypothetical protein [Streptomyces sp. NPDC002287]